MAEKNNNIKERSLYDIKAKHIKFKEFTLEVKNDVKYLTTNNIFIELYNPRSNKLSGLSVCTADFFVIKLGPKLYISNTKKLKEFVEKEKPLKYINKAGDGNSTGLIYCGDFILPLIFQRFDEWDNVEFASYISVYLDDTI